MNTDAGGAETVIQDMQESANRRSGANSSGRKSSTRSAISARSWGAVLLLGLPLMMVSLGTLLTAAGLLWLGYTLWAGRVKRFRLDQP